MIAASVCSGIGAPECAWRDLGIEFAFCSEIEPFPSAVLQHHYPEVENLGDFTRIGSGWTVDILVGGTPCQDFSVAGLRAGMDGKRGQLTVEFALLAGRLRPRWLVWENVPGILSIDQGRAFGIFLGLLGELGYGFAYRILDAQFFGVAQRRRRVFVVGHLGDWRAAAAVLFERESLSGHPPPRRETRERAAPTISARTRGGGGLGTDFDCDGGLVPEIVSQAMSSKWSKGTSGPSGDEVANLVAVAHSLRADGFDAGEDGTGRGTPMVACFSAGQSAGAGTIAYREEQSPTLRGAASGTNQIPAVAFTLHGADKTISTASETEIAGSVRTKPPGSIENSSTTAVLQAVAFTERTKADGRNFESQEELAYALTNPDSGDRTHSRQVAAGMAVRRLTPRECERLQGFPDDYTLITYNGKPAADGPRYKALGNAMAVPVMRWIGERILMVEEL